VVCALLYRLDLDKETSVAIECELGIASGGKIWKKEGWGEERLRLLAVASLSYSFRLFLFCTHLRINNLLYGANLWRAVAIYEKPLA